MYDLCKASFSFLDVKGEDDLILFPIMLTTIEKHAAHGKIETCARANHATFYSAVHVYCLIGLCDDDWLISAQPEEA